NNAVAQTITIGNSTGATAVAIQCGTGACDIGNNATDHSTALGSETGTSALNLRAGTGGILLGSGGIANTIQIGNTTGAVAQTINIGNNATGSSTNTVTVGSIIGSSATNVQGGSNGVTVKTGGSTGSSSAFQIQNAAGTSTYFQINNSGTNNIITIGGNNSGEVQDWATTNTISARQYHSSVTYNGYVYVIGGSSTEGAFTAQSTVYYAKIKSDGSVDTWTTASNALPDARYLHSSVAANGYVYVIGGNNGSGAQSTVYYAKLNSDGSVGVWQSTSSMPAVRLGQSSVVANGYVYAMGGYDGSTRRDTVYYAKLNSDGSLGSWQTSANVLPGARHLHSSVVANGYVYVSGGLDSGGSPTSTIY
ncbi:MAG: hypothetical protein AAB971_03920, partial [Patescibacteria group bacterium]